MRRDFGSELIVAIVAVAVLAFALTFGIIISLSGSASPPPAVLLPTSTPPPDSASAGVIPPGASAIPPTIAPPLLSSFAMTATAIAAVPAVPVSQSPTNTPTPVPPTNTATNTAAPTNTLTNTPTPVPPTNTATFTPTRTATRIPPTSTPSVTSSVTSTITSSVTPTHTLTRIPPSPTATRTVVVLPTITPLTSPAAIPTLALPTAATLPTAVTLPDGLPIPTGAPPTSAPPIVNRFGCTAPAGWIAYALLPGDTLYSVTVRAASEIAIIAAINCLPPDSAVTAGDVIFLPVLPAPAPTLIPIFPGGTAIPGTPAADQAAALPLTASGCTGVGSRIASPRLGEILTAPVTVTGTAFVPAEQGSFATYTLAVRPALSPVYTIYAIGDQPVEFGTLAVLNPGWFGGGVHYLRLTVTRADGSTALPCDIPVIFGSP